MNNINVDVDAAIAEYVWIRDRIAELTKKYEAEKKKLSEHKEKVGAILEGVMDATNTDSLKSDAGTCYKSVRYTASLADPDAFMKYVIDHQRFDLLERRAATEAVKEYVTENNSLPPGCNLSAMQTLGVRRAPGS